MNILIATPAFGGLVTTKYLTSLLETKAFLSRAKISHSVYFLENESLIPRARNKCAQYALENNFTDLIFIDADISWSPQDFLYLIESEHDIIGGTYPIKSLPIKMNFNALPGDPWNESERNMFDYAIFLGDTNEPREVAHLPTGFLRIKTDVFRELTKTKVPYLSHEPSTGNTKTYYDFFPSGQRLNDYLSEDYYFCEEARAAGFKIMLQPEIKLTHTGNYAYSGY